MIINKINSGSYCKVYLAKELHNSEKLFAVKMYQKKLLFKSKESLSNIRREKYFTENISNPFIINLEDSFQNKHFVFLIYKYHKHGDLFNLLKKSRFLPSESLAQFFIIQMYEALSHLHKENIVFRDLKLENIIIDDFGYLKLIDFGFTKQLDKGQTEVRESFLCGTLEYLCKSTLFKNSA